MIYITVFYFLLSFNDEREKQQMFNCSLYVGMMIEYSMSRPFIFSFSLSSSSSSYSSSSSPPPPPCFSPSLRAVLVVVVIREKQKKRADEKRNFGIFYVVVSVSRQTEKKSPKSSSFDNDS